MAYFLIFAAALLRILSHFDVIHVPHNVEPLAATVLFGAVYLNKKIALFLPLGVMGLSDFFIGFDSLSGRAVVYGSFAAIGLVGLWLRSHKTAGNVIGASLASSFLFYVVTNFVYFYPETMYTHDVNGMAASYLNALPFFRNTLLGDLFYTSVFFGSYESLRVWTMRKSAAGVPVR